MTSLPTRTGPGSDHAARLDSFIVGQRIHEATRWFLTSGIQDRSGSPRKNGGFYAWYDEPRGDYAYLYAEITGYMITALCSFRHLK